MEFKRRESPFWKSGCAARLFLSAWWAVTRSRPSGTRTWQRKISVCAQHEAFRKHSYYNKAVFKIQQLGRHLSPCIPVLGTAGVPEHTMWMFCDFRPAWAQWSALDQGSLQPQHQSLQLKLQQKSRVYALHCLVFCTILKVREQLLSSRSFLQRNVLFPF